MQMSVGCINQISLYEWETILYLVNQWKLIIVGYFMTKNLSWRIGPKHTDYNGFFLNLKAEIIVMRLVQMMDKNCNPVHGNKSRRGLIIFILNYKTTWSDFTAPLLQIKIRNNLK